MIVEVTITVKKSQEARYNLDPGSFFIKFFQGQATAWGRNQALKIGCILEFKQSTGRDEGFLEVEDAEANEQHKSIIGVLKAAALEPKWEFEQINFVVCNHRSVVESDFYNKLKKLDIQEGTKDKLLADHVTQVCEAHNQVIVSSKCKKVRGQLQRGRGRTLGTMCTCGEIERGTHACRASKLGPVERWWTQDVKLGFTIQDPPPKSGRRTHYCILLIRMAFCHMSGNLPLRCLFNVTMKVYFCFLC